MQGNIFSMGKKIRKLQKLRFICSFNLRVLNLPNLKDTVRNKTVIFDLYVFFFKFNSQQ